MQATVQHRWRRWGWLVKDCTSPVVSFKGLSGRKVIILNIFSCKRLKRTRYMFYRHTARLAKHTTGEDFFIQILLFAESVEGPISYFFFFVCVFYS